MTRNETKRWRLLDTGVLDAAANMAWDDALLEARARTAASGAPGPNTVRFLQFAPAAVLVGYHQRLADEVRLDFCRERNIDVNRRITGGGAIYFDASHLGWEVVADGHSFDLGVADAGFFARLSAPLVRALRRLGVAAAFRPRNDIEVNGRKISGTGGTGRGDAFLFQGTLLVDLDVQTMMRALRTPVEKLRRREVASVADRVTWLSRELGAAPGVEELKALLASCFEEAFGITLEPAGPTAAEQALFDERVESFRSPGWIDRVAPGAADSREAVAGTYPARAGGAVKVILNADLGRRRLKQAFVVGDFFVYPGRAPLDLEAALKDVELDYDAVTARVARFFDEQRPAVVGLTADDVLAALTRAWEKLRLADYGLPPALARDLFLVNGGFADVARARPRALLLPYCAKSAACGFRYAKDCPACDACTVGAACRWADERGWAVTTVTSFEDLLGTLRGLKAAGAAAFVGCCCEAFYVKHQRDFEDAGLAAVLVNINSETCYDLNRAADAYAGAFESQTELNLPLLKRVLDAL